MVQHGPPARCNYKAQQRCIGQVTQATSIPLLRPQASCMHCVWMCAPRCLLSISWQSRVCKQCSCVKTTTAQVLAQTVASLLRSRSMSCGQVAYLISMKWSVPVGASNTYPHAKFSKLSACPSAALSGSLLPFPASAEISPLWHISLLTCSAIKSDQFHLEHSLSTAGHAWLLHCQA